MFSRLADLASILFGGLKNTLKKNRVQRVGAALFLFSCLTLLTAFQFYPERMKLEVGQVAPRTVKAPRSAVFEDTARTEELRREAASRVPKIYDFDPKVVDTIQEDIRGIINSVTAVMKDPEKDQAAKEAALKESLPFTLRDEVVKALAGLPEERLKRLAQELKQLVGQAMAQGVRQEDLPEAKKSLTDQLELLSLEPAEKVLARAIIQHTLRPNKFYNAASTERLQQEAMEQVSPVEITVRTGEKIIGEGEVVTPEHIAKLKAVGLYHSRLPLGMVIGVSLTMLLLTGVLFHYLYQQHREVYLESAYLYLIALAVVSVLLVAKIVLAVDVQLWPGIANQLGYAVPVATTGMLVAILLDSRIAVVAVVITAIAAGMMTNSQLQFILSGFVTGVTGVYSVSRVSRRGDLLWASLYVSIAAILTIFALGLALGTPVKILVVASLGLGIFNGLLSSVLTNGALPVFEHLFGITSPVRLLELTNPGEPLLKRLLMEAPGTYHHSIVVGNLGEAAAEAIGAEVMTVRAGAYYHDIGKLRRPYFFVENQMGQDNPHDKLAPTLSTLIIISHVKDGVEVAREYKLPEKIVAIIEQHHGTSLAGYFYQKAQGLDQKDAPSEADFRYPGPKPQTREAAIVMLADAVEAAVRSLGRPAPGQVEGLVRRIIKDKLRDGQLDECALTFRDLELIAAAFVRVLSGIFHSRVEYPRERSEPTGSKTAVSGEGGAAGGGDSPESAGGNSGDGEARVGGPAGG